MVLVRSRSSRGRWALPGIFGLVSLGACLSAMALPRDAGASPPSPPPPPAAAAGERVRIGTYDSRAVAVAYGRSKGFLARVNDLREQHRRAKEAGDEPAAERLAKEAQQLQLRLHLQGFSNAPVDDILAQVADRLPDVAQRRGVVAVVPSATYRDDARVEVLDVTDDLTALFEPDAQTRKVIADLKGQAPLPIEQVARMDHGKH